jgi:uncharacterized lipoprotein YajG
MNRKAITLQIVLIMQAIALLSGCGHDEKSEGGWPNTTLHPQIIHAALPINTNGADETTKKLPTPEW